MSDPVQPPAKTPSGGSYHAVNEFVWRHNERKSETPMFFSVLDRVALVP